MIVDGMICIRFSTLGSSVNVPCECLSETMNELNKKKQTSKKQKKKKKMRAETREVRLEPRSFSLMVIDKIMQTLLRITEITVVHTHTCTSK